MKSLTERYQADLLGALSCYDRIIITGTLPGACYAGGMTSFQNSRHIKIFDYAKAFADPLRERIRQCALELANAHGVAIEHVNKPHIRKEDLVAKVIALRGKHPGLVHILSAMEACSAYIPWHDKNFHKTFLRPTSGKCCTITSTSTTRRSACVTCACPPGVPSVCSFTATFNCTSLLFVGRNRDWVRQYYISRLRSKVFYRPTRRIANLEASQAKLFRAMAI